MTDKDDELLADLLIRWEENKELSAQDLCRDSPHLADELARRIEGLKATSWLDKPVEAAEASDGTNPSTTSTPRTLASRYRLDDLIAEGGFAQVWRGYDLELQRVVAVKVPKPNRLESADSFMAEARRVARLKHPGIVPVFDVGRDGEQCFIVSEYVEAGSLADHIRNNPPSQHQTVRWLAEIADALEYAHLHGVVHRDIKPANILIDHHNRALLADFGIAQSANKSAQQAVSLGTLRYMSPEQLEGKTVDPRADIFSLGVVLHEALTGRLPYSSDEPNVLRREIVSGVKSLSAPELPAELRRTCEKALQRDPQHRHTSAAHFAADLRRWLSSEKPRSGKRLLVAGVVLLVVAALVVVVWLKWPGPQNPRTNPASVEEVLARGKQSFDAKKYPDAITAYSQALEFDPTCAEAYHRRGASLFNTGKLQDALTDFDKAVELDPKNGELRRHRSLALSQLRQYHKAIADLEEAVRLNPADQHECKKLLGINWLYKSLEHQKNLRWKEAIADLDVAIKWEAAAVHFHQRGTCYLNLKEPEKAVADFTEAIKREPDVARHYEKRALAYQALGRVDEAKVDSEKAKNLAVEKGK